ncbi:hypothetical protein [Thioflexithrix psekupsensis]|uniref:hypothetical protein n=1 Tax=Thioflexithrix psekupsensis TaxID=1570016 RepID=UPI0015948703|nr:hypothetical protein [Thioflexithrix psekupsensis]
MDDAIAYPPYFNFNWVVNNVLSIAQQWVITKKIAGDVSLTNYSTRTTKGV